MLKNDGNLLRSYNLNKIIINRISGVPIFNAIDEQTYAS